MSSSTPARGLSAEAFSSVFQAINGLHNRRALTAMVACLGTGVLVFGLCSFLAMRVSFFMAFLGGLALFGAGTTGINAAGLLLLDQAKGAPARGTMDAIVDGLICVPKFILLGLALLAVALGVWIAITLLYVVCKIPVLGVLLFVVVFPVSVVISGVTVGGLFVCLCLALPAIWDGASVTRAISQALSIVRHRAVESLALLAMVGLLSAVVGFIVFGVLFAGLMPSIGLSASVLGGGDLGQMMRGGADLADSGGYRIAAGIGAGLLWALAGSLVSLVNLLGLNLVYLRVTEGLDAGAAEAALKARVAEAKQQAAELARKTRDAAERVREQSRQSAAAAAAAQASAVAAAAPTAAAANAPPAAPSSAAPLSPAPPTPPRAVPREAPGDSTMPSMKKVLACPQCLSAIAAEDVFCGVCGYKLK